MKIIMNTYIIPVVTHKKWINRLGVNPCSYKNVNTRFLQKSYYSFRCYTLPVGSPG